MDLGLEFREIIKKRRTMIQKDYSVGFNDEKEIVNLLLKDYNETIYFLNSATNIEIACVIDGLKLLVKSLNKNQAQQVIEIFKKKRQQFPNIQNFTSTNFDKEIMLAEQYIK